MAKSKKTKPIKLYAKGKPLTKLKTEFIKKVASLSKKDISTPAKLKKFYESNKDEFVTQFESGITSIPRSSTQVFNKIDKAEKYGKRFFIETETGKKEVSANELKYEMSKTELALNNLFGSTGAEFSYRIDFENNITVKIPDIQDEEFYEDESMEIIVDHFSDDYGINIYISEPKTKEDKEKHKQYVNEYETKVKQRIKEFKPKRKYTKSGKRKISNRRKKG